MKQIRIQVITLIILLLACSNLLAQDNHSHVENSKADVTRAFEKFKSLVGKWKAKTEKGFDAYIYFESVSNGTAVHERFIDEGDKVHSNIVTVYFRDKEALMANHFCAMGNQPRLRTTQIAADLSEMTFSLLDITNLKTPEAAHMYKVTYKFQDPNHMATIWTMRQGGKDVYVETLNWERQK
jgi:hypothetical protein